MPIGEAARRVGLAPSALRYYEERAVVRPARRVGGRRWYGRDELRRLAFVQVVQGMGLDLETIAAVLNGTGRPWREVVDEHLRWLDDRIVAAERARRILAHARSCAEDEPWRTCEYLLAELDAWLAAPPGERTDRAEVVAGWPDRQVVSPARPPGPDADADPLERFLRWRREAYAAGAPLPDAMVLATVDPDDGSPDARTVLLAYADPRGFSFFSDRGSAKARALAADRRAALVFGWYAIGRQVRVAGTVTPIEVVEVAAEWAAVPREHQLAVWACRQSTVVPDRAALEAAYDEAAARWPEGTDIPLPKHWGGWRLRPYRYDFWRTGARGINDRCRYRRDEAGYWVRELLAP